MALLLPLFNAHRPKTLGIMKVDMSHRSLQQRQIEVLITPTTATTSITPIVHFFATKHFASGFSRASCVDLSPGADNHLHRSRTQYMHTALVGAAATSRTSQTLVLLPLPFPPRRARCSVLWRGATSPARTGDDEQPSRGWRWEQSRRRGSFGFRRSGTAKEDDGCRYPPAEKAAEIRAGAGT